SVTGIKPGARAHVDVHTARPQKFDTSCVEAAVEIRSSGYSAAEVGAQVRFHPGINILLAHVGRIRQHYVEAAVFDEDLGKLDAPVNHTLAAEAAELEGDFGDLLVYRRPIRGPLFRLGGEVLLLQCDEHV